MRNLILQRERYVPPPVDQEGGGDAIDVAYLDSNNIFYESDDEESSACFVLQNSGELRAFVNHKRQIHWQVDLNSTLERDPTEERSNGWFSVKVLAQEQMACCLNQSTGAIVTVSLQDSLSSSSAEPNGVELVGEFENGILAAEWSPDCQILALVVNQEEDDEQQTHTMLITMTSQFEVLSEVLLQSRPMSEPTSTMPFLLSLSWRPDGKWLAVLSSGRDSENSAATSQQPPFILRIYDPRDLASTPPAVGRTEDGSGKLLQNFGGTSTAWAGSSCSLLLATTQSTGSKRKIRFVESNGLAHGDFTLRDKNCTIHQMAWSPTKATTTVLAIHLSTESVQGDVTVVEEKVQLWYRSNYHWYMKQEFRYTPSNHIACLRWSTLEEDHLTVLLKNGARYVYRFRWQESITCAAHSNIAFVVDGSGLLSTPLAKMIVPPPMSHSSLALEAPVRDIALADFPPSIVDGDDSFQENGSTVMGLVHLSNNALVVLGTQEVKDRDYLSKPQVLAQISGDILRKELKSGDPSLFPSSPGYLFHSLLVISVNHEKDGNSHKSSVEAIALAIDESEERILHFVVSYRSLTDEGRTNLATDVSIRCIDNTLFQHGRVLTLTNWFSVEPSSAQSSDRSVLVQLTNGELFEYIVGSEGETGKMEKSEMDALLEPCPWIVGIKRTQTEGEDEHRVIGMSWRKRLYCGEVLLSDSVSSFDVSDRYVCYATAAASHCELKFIAKSQIWELDPLMGASEENVAIVSAEYEPRNAERGSHIVTVLSNKPMAVLQMPRGNLEGVYARALVLPHVLSQLCQGAYRNALEMMRQQKVDLNLLVDWNPASFLDSGAKDLLEQVSNVDHLNLFISSLRNENVTQTIHALPSWLLEDLNLSLVTTDQFDFSTKVNQVCRKLRELMEKSVQVGDALLFPVLSTYAKEEPPQLHTALSLIESKALENEGASEARSRKKQPPLFSERSQSAFQYLAFLATYQKLFDTALGMYNLELARAVARNSQMDPKEYLPLLERLRNLPPAYAKHEIDMRLERYPNALRNLVESANQEEEGSDGNVKNTFDDCLLLIKKHSLHTLGLELFHQESRNREILIDLGQRLLDSGEAQNALTISLTIPEPAPVELILKAARKCRDWQTFFSYTSPPSADGPEKSAFVNQARDFAQEMAAGATTAGGRAEKRQLLSDAARIMLDYAHDVPEAIEHLLHAEMWTAAQRVAKFHGTSDLMKKCTDTAVGNAYSALDELNERASTFESTMERYIEVLRLRKEAYNNGTDIPPSENADGDDSASLFSASSQVSYLTGASRSSTGSTRSSASLSTVISIASNNSSFSLTGADQENRHKSKYNQIGRTKGKQKKKKGKGRTKVVPGSERELQGLVDTLETTCFDSTLVESLSDCIVFLYRTKNMALAVDMYDCFEDSAKRIRASMERRKRMQQDDWLKLEEKNRREGIRELNFVHPLEKKVEALKCDDLPDNIRRLFEVIPRR